MTPAWDELIRRSVEYLNACQARLRDEFSLGAWPRYDYDQDASTLTFSWDGRPAVVAPMHVGARRRRNPARGSGRGTTPRSCRR